jgi:N-acetyl-anhydromuramyl-L-alanine amidase AmpD
MAEIGKIKKLVVHVSDSPQGRGDTAKTINRWHLEKKWDGIGYHSVILEDGTIENGRPIYWKGSHVGAFNSESLGVCLIGKGGDATQEQLLSLHEQLMRWLTLFPDAEICGHTDLDPRKTCPGFDVKKWWVKVNDYD